VKVAGEEEEVVVGCVLVEQEVSCDVGLFVAEDEIQP